MLINKKKLEELVKKKTHKRERDGKEIKIEEGLHASELLDCMDEPKDEMCVHKAEIKEILWYNPGRTSLLGNSDSQKVAFNGWSGVVRCKLKECPKFGMHLPECYIGSTGGFKCELEEQQKEFNKPNHLCPQCGDASHPLKQVCDRVRVLEDNVCIVLPTKPPKNVTVSVGSIKKGEAVCQDNSGNVIPCDCNKVELEKICCSCEYDIDLGDKKAVRLCKLHDDMLRHKDIRIKELEEALKTAATVLGALGVIHSTDDALRALNLNK